MTIQVMQFLMQSRYIESYFMFETLKLPKMTYGNLLAFLPQ